MISSLKQRLRTAFFVCALLGGAQPAVTDEAVGFVLVEMGGLGNVSGDIHLSVYDNEDDWLGESTVLSTRIVIEDNRDGDFVVHELKLPLGEYALTIYYDANGNGDLDTNFIGLPKEPVALSNNAKMKFGPPKYDDAKFQLSLEPVVQRINFVDL